MMHGTDGSPLPFAFASTLAVAALVYARRWFDLRRRLPGIVSPLWLFSFLSGLGAVWVAIGSPLAAFDEELLTVHMVQHLLLSLVAAPLILLGATALLPLDGLPRGRVFGHPAICWSVATVVLIGWHVPAIFELGMRSKAWHAVEQASFLGSGLLFWWPVIQPWPSVARWPRWSIPLYLFCATLPCDALSAFLAFSDRVVYPMYLSSPRHFGLSVLEDQESAGAVMWLCVTIAYVIPAAIITTNLLSPRDEAARDRQGRSSQPPPSALIR
jgi:cytochrome c oxidase assembly factor CtaG